MSSSRTEHGKRKRQRAFILSLIPLFIFCYVMYLGVYRSSSFLSNVDHVPSNGWICARLDVSKLWRIGNGADPLVKHLTENTSLSIDSQRIPPYRTESDFTADLIGVGDPFGFGIGLGTRNSVIAACADTTGLQAGKHIVTIETRTTMGEAYSYWWEITVP